MAASTLQHALNEVAINDTDPAGEQYRALSLESAGKLQERFGLQRRTVELEALREGIVPRRYQRSIGTIGIEGQIKLLETRAAVIGAGGLGGLVVELLARMGVGALTVADGDHFSDSNLNRQLLAAEEDLGVNKAVKARERAVAVNPAVEVALFEEFISQANIDNILEGCSVALDCLDNLSARFILEAGCQRMGIPMVHGAVAGHMGQLAVSWPMTPLAIFRMQTALSSTLISWLFSSRLTLVSTKAPASTKSDPSSQGRR